MARDPPQRVHPGVCRWRHRSRVIWIADLLPNDLGDLVGGLMDQGCAAMKRTLAESNQPIPAYENVRPAPYL
jgi:hypothetical protein